MREHPGRRLLILIGVIFGGVVVVLLLAKALFGRRNPA